MGDPCGFWAEGPVSMLSASRFSVKLVFPQNHAGIALLSSGFHCSVSRSSGNPCARPETSEAVAFEEWFACLG